METILGSVSIIKMTYKEYKKECEERWYGVALHDALTHWKEWEGMRDYLTDAMKQFRRNPFQTDGNGKYYNPDGTLSKFLWNCQEAIDPTHTKLNPFLDFEEHYQKIFLRRGLIIYCKALLEEIEFLIPKDAPLFESQSLNNLLP